MLAQQKQQLTRARELGGVAKTATTTIEGPLKLIHRYVEGIRRCQLRLRARRAVSGRHRPQPLQELRRRVFDARPLCLPYPSQLAEEIREARAAPLRRRREVRAAEERLQLRGE